MSWINDAHTEWHTVNGWRAVCPLDCGAAEWLAADDAPDDPEVWTAAAPVIPAAEPSPF